MVTLAVNSSCYQMRPQVSMVLIQHAANNCDEGSDSCFPSTVQPLQFQIGGYKQIDELSICSRSRTTTVDVGGDIVNFLAVLFNNNGSSGCSGIGCQNYSIFEEQPYDGGTSFLEGRLFDHPLVNEVLIPARKVKVEAPKLLLQVLEV